MKTVCEICGGVHRLPAALAFRRPDVEAAGEPWIGGSESLKLGPSRFLRGNVVLHGGGETCVFGVWVEIDARTYKRALALFRSDRRAAERPYAGRLANALPGYRETTLGLGAELLPAPPGRRFAVALQGAHPLREHLEDGMDEQERSTLAKLLAHGL